MKHLYPKSTIGSWLIVIVFFSLLQTVNAQCPAGSLSPVAGTTYTNGKVVCISTNFNGNLKFNNGSKLVIVSGGTYTGDFDGNPGSEIVVKAGGTFKPNNANNLASSIKNEKNGTVTLGTGGLTLANGFSAENYGTFNWLNSATLGNHVEVTNTSCGRMSFSQNLSMQNGSTLNNSGNLTIQNLITDAGSSIDNRGRLTVNGDFAPKGYFKNQWQALFLGSNNNFNSGADSIINLYTFVVKNSINGVMNMRNEGLFWLGGAFTLGNGGGIKMVRTNAQLRVSGSFSNNGAVSGNGKVHVGGGFANGGSLNGKSAAEKLSLKQAASGVGTNVNTQVNASMAADDTTGYAGGAGNPDVSCSMLLPMVVSSFKGAWYDNGVNLSWYTVSEINGKQFDIEYSADGLSYTKVGEVAARGNSNEKVNYQYRFTNITSATLYFRLMMVDRDGRTEYSNVVMVKTGVNTKVTTTVYPNPFADKLDITVTLPKPAPVTVKLVDMNGRAVRTQVYTAQSGSNKWTWTGLSGLNKGLYLLEVTAGEEKWMQKLIR